MWEDKDLTENTEDLTTEWDQLEVEIATLEHGSLCANERALRRHILLRVYARIALANE